MAKSKKDYTYAVGRRKSASARVRLHKGKGENIVNGMDFLKYFPGEVSKVKLEMPFKVTDTLGKYYVTARVVGSGKQSQLEAITLGIARSLSLLEGKNFRGVLKTAGLLTRDARIRERRKVGMGGKARRKKQSPKR